MSDTKFDSKAISTAYMGYGYLEGRKCAKGNTVDFKNNAKVGAVLVSTSYWADPTFFPFRKTGVERVTSYSVGRYMSGKEEFQQEIPLYPPYEDWINASVIENQLTFDEQQELNKAAEDSDKPTSRSIDDQKIYEIVGYNEPTDQYILQSAGEITLVESSELFEKVRNNDIVFVNGIKGVIQDMSVSYGEDDEIFVLEGTQMEVETFTLSDFNEKPIEIFDTADSMREYNTVRDNIKQVIL